MSKSSTQFDIYLVNFVKLCGLLTKPELFQWWRQNEGFQLNTFLFFKSNPLILKPYSCAKAKYIWFLFFSCFLYSWDFLGRWNGFGCTAVMPALVWPHLTHNVAHSTMHSFWPKTINQPLKKFLSLAFSWVKVVKNRMSF